MFIFVYLLLALNCQDAPKPIPEPPETAKEPKTQAPPGAIFQEREAEDGIYRTGQVGVDPPVITKKVYPAYPKDGKRLKIEGYVILEATFKTDGTVAEIKVLRGLGRGKLGFEQNAMDAVRQWEFKPGTFEGNPADIRMVLKIDYVL